jgi:hypothetical protein
LLAEGCWQVQRGAIFTGSASLVLRANNQFSLYRRNLKEQIQ